MSPLWFWILGFLLSAVTAIGNGFLICLISKRRRLHTPANCLILSLAVADFCVGVTSVPLKLICEFWPAGYCTVLLHFRWFFIYASVCNLCAMATERYISIVKPLRYNTLMRGSRLVVLVLAAWSVPIAIRLITFSVVYKYDKEAALKYLLPVVLVLFEIMPCALLVVVTTRMVLIARKISRRTAVLASQLRFNHVTTKARGTEFSTVKVIAVVVVFFILCYVASLFTTFCDMSDRRCSTLDYIRYLRRLCLVTNSAANPIAYSFLKRDIRKELKITFVREKETRSSLQFIGEMRTLERFSDCRISKPK